MGVNVPIPPKSAIKQVTDFAGICRACRNCQVSKDLIGVDKFKLVVCDKEKKPSYLVRRNLLSCRKFIVKKGRSSVKSSLNILRAIFISLRHNNWEPLKKAISYELQN